MKVKNKGRIKYFLAAAVVTALVIILICMLIIAEANTSTLGLKRISNVFSLYLEGSNLSLLVNDRRYALPLDEVYLFFESKAPFFISAVWLVL